MSLGALVGLHNIYIVNKNLEILLKLGSQGAMFIDKSNSTIKQNAFKFDDLPIVDTTGAGKINFLFNQ